MALEVQVVTISPADALAMLEANTGNRSIRQGRVQTYARDMKAKQWKLNGDPIRVNGKGKLLDGQHRLLACVLADTPFETVLIKGVGEDAHATIDTGAARKLSDELKYRGEKNVTALSSGLNLVWLYESGGTTSSGQRSMSRSEAMRLLHKQPEIRGAVAAAEHVGRSTGILTSALIAAAHILQREHGQEKMQEFLDELESGTDYQPGHPCLVLREYAVRVGRSRALRPRREEWLAYIIKAMNAWLVGRPVGMLAWRRVGPKAEGFPQMLSQDDV